MPSHGFVCLLLSIDSFFGVVLIAEREVGTACSKLAESFLDNRIGLVDNFEIAVEPEDVACYQRFYLINNQWRRNVDVVPARCYSTFSARIVDKRLQKNVVGRQAR